MCVRVIVVFWVAGFLGACSSDGLPFSGGALTGSPTPLPRDLTELAAAQVIQLETRPERPYSVNLWVVGLSENLYVFAGSSKSNWVEHIEANPDVRIKIGDAIYALRASLVKNKNKNEFETFARGWEAKYGRRPFNENVDETYLVRLVAR